MFAWVSDRPQDDVTQKSKADAEAEEDDDVSPQGEEVSRDLQCSGARDGPVEPSVSAFRKHRCGRV